MLSTGLRLCGIVDEPPPAPDAHLADLRLSEQRDVERDLRRGSGDDVERRADLGDAHAVRVPRPGRHGEPELLGEQAHDLGAGVLERGERPRRSGELGAKAVVAERRKTFPRVEQPSEPRGRLRPERRRYRLLEQGPPRPSASHDACLRDRRTPRPTVSSERGDEIDGVAGDEHRGRVQDVLAGRAPVDVARRVAADGLGKLPDERLDGVAGRPAPFRERRGIEAIGIARRRDRLGGVAGDDAGARLGERERALRVEHRLEPGAIRDCRTKLVGNEDPVEHVRRRRTRSDVRPGAARRTRAHRRPRGRRASRGLPRRRSR